MYTVLPSRNRLLLLLFLVHVTHKGVCFCMASLYYSYTELSSTACIKGYRNRCNLIVQPSYNFCEINKYLWFWQIWNLNWCCLIRELFWIQILFTSKIIKIIPVSLALPAPRYQVRVLSVLDKTSWIIWSSWGLDKVWIQQQRNLSSIHVHYYSMH
jgi:hypothetical protein